MAIIDKESWVTHHELVGILSNDDHLRKALVECLRDAGVTTALSRSVLPDLLQLCEHAFAVVRDPETGLTIPIGRPSIRYVDRPKGMFIGEYAQAQWPLHVSAELLFFEDIHKVAPDFHRACRFQAEQVSANVHDYVLSYGILSRPVMTQDPVRYDRQLGLLTALDHVNKANTLMKTAKRVVDDVTR